MTQIGWKVRPWYSTSAGGSMEVNCVSLRFGDTLADALGPVMPRDGSVLVVRRLDVELTVLV